MVGTILCCDHREHHREADHTARSARPARSGPVRQDNLSSKTDILELCLT